MFTYVVVTRTIYFGNVDVNKAFKEDLEVDHVAMGTILELAKPLQPKVENLSAIQVVWNRFYINPKTLNFVKNLKAVGKDVEIFNKEIPLKFCLIAEGLAYVYPCFSPTMEWDTAAVYPICNASGVSIETIKALVYDKGSLLNRYFLIGK